MFAWFKKIKKKFQKFVKESEFFIHETKHKALIKFLSVITIIIAYFSIVSFHLGLENGVLVTILTWTFFVFCTPIADAGFLIDFPMRLITGMRMLYSEMMVWVVAFTIVISSLTLKPELFEKSTILLLFKDILSKPWPFWSIIALSALGTFFSVTFGDELIDVAKHSERKHYQKHKNKYRIIVTLSILVLTIIIYYSLMNYYHLKF